MRALRTFFFFATATAACFSDSGVKVGIARAARVVVAVSGVLFLIAEAMEMFS